MAEIAIWSDSKRRGRCRSCGAAIEWADTRQGKAIPFDGPIVVARSQGNPLLGRTIEYVETTITPTHFETCPQAATWRKRR
jgi:hypothetical protein